MWSLNLFVPDVHKEAVFPVGGGRLYSGENNWIYFVPGTAEDNGTWYHGTTSTGGTAGTRNGRVIDFGVSATFDETSALVDGLVPYGDIP